VSALRSPWLHVALRLALGGFFLYASVGKILAPSDFARAVYQWQVVGPVPSNLVAVTLPWMEALAGVLLIAGLWKREAALAIAAMLLVFVLAAGSVIARGIDVENCGCVSPARHATVEKPRWWQGVGWFLIARNLVMLGAAAVLILVEPRRREGAAAAVPGGLPGSTGR
jgi:putative oxidoreductase